jgi:multiple sugar transport system permease protein
VKVNKKQGSDLLPIQLASIPAIIVVVLAASIILYSALTLSATNAKLSNQPAEFVGVNNFLAATEDHRFIESLLSQALVTTLSVSVEISLGLLLSYEICKSTKRVQSFAIVMLVIPLSISQIVIGSIWVFLFNHAFGLVSYVLNSLSIRTIDLMNDPSAALLLVVLADVWQWTPLVIIIMLAGMRTLQRNIWDAAEIDGASDISFIRRIVVPTLRPFIIIAIVLRILESLKIFELLIPFQGTVSLPNFYIFTQSFHYGELGYASALGLLLFILSSSILIVFLRIRGER